MSNKYDLKTGNLDDLVEYGMRISADGFLNCEIFSRDRREIIYHFKSSENASSYMTSVSSGSNGLPMRIEPNLTSAVIITHI